MNDSQIMLLARAKLAAARAYARYSQFRVGAAVLAGGRVFVGANIENASSNLGICAERVAIAHARVRGKANIAGIAVFCADAPPGPKGLPAVGETLPCGACRQWIAELAPDAWIVTNGSARVYSIEDLLPKPFRLPRGAARTQR